MKKSLVFLLFFFSFTAYAAEQLSVESSCYDLLVQEVKKEIHTTLKKDSLAAEIPALYKDFQSTQQLKKYKEAYDFFLKNKMDEDYFSVQHFSYGEVGGFNLYHSNNVFQLWPAGIINDPITEGSIMLVSSAKDNNTLYCRSRINVVVNHPDKTLATVKNTDVLLSDTELPFKVEHLEYNGFKFKKVFFIRNILDHKGVPLLERNEMYIIPEKNAPDYNVYLLVDTLKQANEKYYEWKEKALTYINSGKNTIATYSSPSTEVKRGKKFIDGFLPITFNNLLSPQVEANIFRYYMFDSMIKNKQSSIEHLFSILNIKQGDDNWKKIYSVVTKDKDIKDLQDKAFLNNKISLYEIDKMRSIAYYRNEKDIYNRYTALMETIKRYNNIPRDQTITPKDNIKITPEIALAVKNGLDSRVTELKNHNNQNNTIFLVGGGLFLIVLFIAFRKKRKKA